VRLRRAFPEDAAQIDRLLERAYPTLMAPSYAPEAFAAALPALTTANAALLSSGTYYVVQGGGTNRLLVGCGGWTSERPGTKEIIPGVAHLRHFATDPDFARQGIGRVIFRECGLGAKRWGATLFQVYSSLNAVPFYTALGLAPVGQMELALAPGVSLAAIVMEGPIRTE
jgi:GNAT superfamily N-acetyltransferase